MGLLAVYCMAKVAVKFTCFQSQSLDVWRNLAIEEYLLTQLGEEDLFLFLWRSRLALVIGRNQNPWRECRWRDLEEAGGMLARRISGGGTVYQDEGNLNFAFMMRRDHYDQQALSALVVEALLSLGLPVHLGARSVIYLGEHKVSGNAFCLRRGVALHHGTLLIKADLGNLQNWLRPSLAGLTGRGIASVPSPVKNLAEARRGLKWEEVAESLIATVAKQHGEPTRRATGILDPAALLGLRSKQASLDWRFGETPEFAFTLALPDLPPLQLTVRHGRLTAVLPGDASPAGAALAPVIAKLWLGVILRATVLADCLREDDTGDPRLAACADWLEEQPF